MKYLKNYWWSIALRGLMLLAFGIIILVSSDQSPVILIQDLGAMFGVVGLLQLLLSIFFRKKILRWKQLTFISVIDLTVAGLIFYSPETSSLWFHTIIAAWTLLVSILLFYLAWKSTELKTLLVINAVLCLLFSLFIFFNPLEDMQPRLVMISIMTLLLGLIMIIVSFRISRYDDKAEKVTDLPETGIADI